MSEMPLGFTWYYEATNDGNERSNVLVVEDQKEVPPLDLNISNLLSDKYVAISAIDGVSQADESNYHFKLTFAAGTLADPNRIAVESADWSIYSVANTDGDSIYLLWTGLTKLLSDQGAMEVILTGVAAQSVQMSTTPDINISWQFALGGIQVLNQDTSPATGDYAENVTLTLNLVKSTGVSNLPLYVGFVKSNKVLNNPGYSTTDSSPTRDTSLQLRLTNKQLPGAVNPDITFYYGADTNLSSQLVVTLEVGTVEEVPWALGTQSQISAIDISIAGDQWVQDGAVKTVEVEGVVQALQWIFIPKDSDVVLVARETLLINLDNIVTDHPTGETNLYLDYRYVPGYQDGQFVCQIEKTPLLTFDNQVGVGLTNPVNFFDVHGSVRIYDVIQVDGIAQFGTITQISGPTTINSSLTVQNEATFNSNVTVNGTINTKSRIKDQTGFVVPVGTIVRCAVSGTEAPEGWLMCNGQTFDTSKYSELGDLLGSHTLPDLTNKFMGVSEKTRGGYIAEKLKALLNGDFLDIMLSIPRKISSTQFMESAGGSQPNENQPTDYAINYIIKA